MAGLWIVMPTYNEASNIELVVREWAEFLRTRAIPFRMLVLNDGSTDATGAELERLASQYSELEIVTKPNSGHGQTAVMGYRHALSKGAEWVFQIDSDGQCDPAYFDAVWEKRLEHSFVFGHRVQRDDGAMRLVVSKIVSLVSLLATWVWVRDANVPYRLMRASKLGNFVNEVPADIYLANILISVFAESTEKIFWVPIRFRNRISGNASVKGWKFAKQGLRLFKQLRSAVRNSPALLSTAPA